MTTLTSRHGDKVKNVYLIDASAGVLLNRSTYFPIGGGSPIITTSRTLAGNSFSLDFLTKTFTEAEEITDILSGESFQITEDALGWTDTTMTASADPQIIPERAGDAIVRWRVSVEAVRV